MGRVDLVAPRWLRRWRCAPSCTRLPAAFVTLVSRPAEHHAHSPARAPSAPQDDGGFVGIQYSASVANFQTPETMMPDNATWHPRIKDLVYYGMDWLCPNYSEVLARQLKANYGNITPESTIRNITAIVQTGDLHVVRAGPSRRDLSLPLCALPWAHQRSTRSSVSVAGPTLSSVLLPCSGAAPHLSPIHLPRSLPRNYPLCSCPCPVC